MTRQRESLPVFLPQGYCHRDISNRGGIWNFRLLVVQPLYTMTRSEILPGGNHNSYIGVLRHYCLKVKPTIFKQRKQAHMIFCKLKMRHDK